MSSHLAHGIQLAVSGRRIWLVAIGLAFDGSLTMLEGWALQRGYVWGAYLVVIVTALSSPSASTWISAAAQAEFVGSEVLPSQPTQIARPADMRIVRSN